MNTFDVLTISRLLILLFLSILFLQSGLDKVLNWRETLTWLTSYFSKTFLKAFVPLLLYAITAFELLAGIMSAVGIIMLAFFSTDLSTQWIGVGGVFFSSLSIVCLFFGQRISKDYASAAAIVPYFIVTIIGLYLFFI